MRILPYLGLWKEIIKNQQILIPHPTFMRLLRGLVDLVVVKNVELKKKKTQDIGKVGQTNNQLVTRFYCTPHLPEAAAGIGRPVHYQTRR